LGLFGNLNLEAGFEVLPKHWIAERTFAWISRNCRLARDFERYATTPLAVTNSPA
jgi:transposase